MVEFEQLEDSQKRAALVHDRNYHLTAGAGSGKTTTFAARYVKLLQQTETDPESIAAITFTETGAMELQERVRKQVTDRLDDLDQEAYDEWRDHLDTLPEAYIHTIHGFCARLLREYALEADVPIGFDIVEETSATVQKRRAVESFLSNHETDEHVARLAEQFYESRLEDLLVDLLNERTKARQWADDWAESSPEEYVEFVASRFMSLDPAEAREILQDTEVRDALDKFQTVAETESSFRRSGIVPDIDEVLTTKAVFTTDLSDAEAYDTVVSICDALTTGDNNPYYGSFDSGTYSGYGDWSAESGRLYSEAVETIATKFDIESWVTGTRYGVEQNASRYYGPLAAVFRDVHDHYQNRKREEGVLDFTDLIDGAIELLEQNPDIRATLRDQFDQLMLDEVQDTDPRQWELVKLLTGNYDDLNVFVVGDEKQSIFRFRGADVSQFAAERSRLEASNTAVELPSMDEIHAVDGTDALTTNFRTLPTVLNPINELFEDLFGTIPEGYADPPTGVSADTSFEPDPQRLSPSRTDDENLSLGADFVVVPEDKSLRESLFENGHQLRDIPEDNTELDATALAIEVSTLLQGDQRTQRYEEYTTPDGELTEQPVDLKPSDIAILLRKRTHLKAYERALAKYNIPYTVASGIGFYETTEIRALKNLFAVLSDPTDDLSLYAVLRSPLFGFEDREIVREWDAVNQDALGEGELWNAIKTSDNAELRAAHRNLTEWRERAGATDKNVAVNTWDRLLGHILDDTGFIAAMATDERGQQAIANIDKFRERLRAWSEDGVQTLPVLIDRLEREIDLSGREGDAEVPEKADGVRIMTVHDAKGREFPAVFVPGLSNTFNWKTGYADSTVEFESLSDGQQEQPLVGIKGPTATDEFDTADTVLKQRLKFARKQELVAEEKRILYVAATRARDHLRFVGTVSTDDGEIDSIDSGDSSEPSSWFDFIGPLAIDEGTRSALASHGSAEAFTSDEHSMTVRFPTSGVDYDQSSDESAPDLSTEAPSVTRESEFSISASYLGSLIEEDDKGDIVVDHTGQYVSYYPSDEGSNDDESDTEGESTENDAEESYFPRNVFGDIVHRAAELRIDSTDSDQIRELAEQYATEHDVSVNRLDDATLTELSEHIGTAVQYLEEETAAAEWSVDEIRVQADLTGGEVQGYIDHLSYSESTYHIVDYKTNKVDSIEDIESDAKKYRWQMRAYAAALHQTDSNDSVRATLLFTELGEPFTMEWEPEELGKLTETLSSEITQQLNERRHAAADDEH